MELTFIPQHVQDEYVTNALAEALAHAVRRVLEHREILYHSCDEDYGAVEVSTNPVFSWLELMTAYKSISREATMFRLAPHHPTVSSGGGHIHLGPLPIQLSAAIQRDMVLRPYINWIFNDSCDEAVDGIDRHVPDETEEVYDAESGRKKLCVTKKVRWARALKKAPTPGSLTVYGSNSSKRSELLFYGKLEFVTSYQCLVGNGYDVSVKYNSDYKTMEFRYFEAARNWYEQTLHMAFAQAYTKWIETRLKHGDPFTLVMPDRQKMKHSRKFCEQQFRRLLSELDLPEAPYLPIMRRNLRDRFEYNNFT